MLGIAGVTSAFFAIRLEASIRRTLKTRLNRHIGSALLNSMIHVVPIQLFYGFALQAVLRQKTIDGGEFVTTSMIRRELAECRWTSTSQWCRLWSRCRRSFERMVRCLTPRSYFGTNRPDRAGLLECSFEPGTLDRHVEATTIQAFGEFSVIVRRVKLVKLHADPVDP